MQLNRRSSPERGYSRPATAWATAVSLIVACASSGLAQAVPKAGYLAEGSFQLPGKGQPGAPDRPTALALAPDRTVHVADGRGLVFVYDSTGVYRRSYGQADLGQPVAICITASGESYVLDADRNQVFVFGPGGQRLRALADKGNRGGQLSNPVDLALGPAGQVYVLDAGRRGVEIFSRDGMFVRTIELTTTSSQPASLAVGNDGWIYVADKRTPTHIFALPPFIRVPWVGSTPQGLAGQISFRGADFQEPVAIAVNVLGSVVVLDKESGRLFRANGTSERSIGPNDLLYGGIGTGRGSFREPVDIAFAGPDQLIILDSRLRKIERIRLTTEEGLERRADFTFPIRVGKVPSGLAAPLYDVGYGPAGNAHFLVDLNNSLTLLPAEAHVYATVYGDSVRAYRLDSAGQQLQFRGDIGRVEDALLTDSSVVAADSRRNRFAVFDLADGRQVGTYGDNYQDDRRLRDPGGVAMLPDGRVVVVDSGNDRVKIFSADLASLVSSYTFSRPAGVAVDPSGEIFVWDESGLQVARLNTEAQTFEPLKEGLLSGPLASATFDQAGNFFTLDRNTHRVTIVRAGLQNVLMQLGAERALDRPTRIRVDNEGNIYLTDEGSKRTAIYRWDVEFPPLTGFDVDFEPDAAVLRWNPGPAGFVRGYVVQGADAADGPYYNLYTTNASPFRVTADNVPATPPHYVRIAPLFITGVVGKGSPPLPLAYFTANRAYEEGDYTAALQYVAEAYELIESGVIEASDEAMGRLMFVATASAYGLGEFRTALDWALRASGYSMPREQLIQFLFMTAETYMRLGNPPAASQQVLALVGQGPRPEYYMDRSVIDQSFRVYRGVRDAGYPEDALEYLRLYRNSIPSSVEALKLEYTDSVTVFSTQHKLGPGFRYWREASYGQVVNFFEGLLTEGGLSEEQTVVARQVLACAYFAFGRRGEAEDTYREIFGVRPEFSLDREIPRLRMLYALTIYNPETQRFFGNIRPGS